MWAPVTGPTLVRMVKGCHGLVRHLGVSQRSSGQEFDMMKDSIAVHRSTLMASGSRLTACAAAWCGVHCAITPFLAVAAPALALSEGVERGVWVGTVVLGAVMLALGPARRSAGLILTFAGGAALWAASLAGWLDPLPENVTSAGGSLILAGALLGSARVCRDGSCSVCADEEDAEQSPP